LERFCSTDASSILGMFSSWTKLQKDLERVRGQHTVRVRMRWWVYKPVCSCEIFGVFDRVRALRKVVDREVKNLEVNWWRSLDEIE